MIVIVIIMINNKLIIIITTTITITITIIISSDLCQFIVVLEMPSSPYRSIRHQNTERSACVFDFALMGAYIWNNNLALIYWIGHFCLVGYLWYSETCIKRPSNFVVSQDGWSFTTGRINKISVRSRNCGCLVTWFCYQLIAKPRNKTATVPWSDPYC